ncbi:protein SUPPRESSOR OF MAX2 1 [Neltuma alba]|uniref:protein SUPPRESSOR OF MAX2 1 n=1 Tax=Neltuma alba TaxID=207710 RepID=UPI0010A5498F|nr:protein SUPPRESSOR OF MAX2 1-like [Prosopis alba]XP_028791040.1 protein SUPPRESSOR OF MAX2 1-like [Prosopis alba]
MRAALSMIQQTLTPEAASVLNQSIAEAGRRNHSQTTPLHVAASLLASPSGFLRQACIKSHPNSSHPLQCRALELCFSVALDRLQTSQNMSAGTEPPISNALMAALKRAQAHQRRGCPELQQQPLLAVKVELEQLIISILDDPSVSRVMREASFSSPAVKAMVEQSLNFSSSSSSVTSNSIGLGIRPKTVTPPATNSRNLYINPRLQSGQQTVDEVKRITDILLRTKKRNPILVGESEPESVMKELLRRIENKEMQGMAFNNARVIFLEKELPSDKAQIPARLKELADLIETRMGNSGSGGVFLNLGDLKWLVEQPVGIGAAGSGSIMQQQALTEIGRAIVAEMTKLVAKFRDTCRLWLMGTATCETYLRCQVYHPSMEIDWDLQAVPVATRAPLSQTFPRFGTNGFFGVSLESLKGFPCTTMVPRHEKADSAPRSMCCPQCTQTYEKEVADAMKDIEKTDSMIRLEATRSSLPQWLQNARTGSEMKDQMMQNDRQKVMTTKTQELQKKWHEACLHLHPKFHQPKFSTERIAPTPLSSMSLSNQNLLGRQSQPKLELNKSLGCSLQLGPPERSSVSPPGSPVTTELALGQVKSGHVKDLLGSISSESQTQSNKLLDHDDSFQKLLKALAGKVWWQKDAASAIATTVTECKMGNGKKRGGVTKGDTWLLFLGPDRASKKKMAEALSEIVSGSSPITFYLGAQRGETKTDVPVRGKTALDRIAEAIRRNPFSVIILEDIHEADLLIRGSIKRAMEQGRFCDSHGREISVGNIMFILTANETSTSEQNVANLNGRSWQLRLSIAKRTTKRRLDWLCHDERFTKPRKESASGLTFNLNEAVESDEDKTDGSMNSSDLTVDHEDNHVTHNIQSPTSSTPFLNRELLDGVDDCVVFKPIDAASIRHSFTAAVEKRFSDIVEKNMCIEVQEVALRKIASGVRLSQTSLDEWIEKALVPSVKQLKRTLDVQSNDGESLVVRLEDDFDGDYGGRRYTDLLRPWVRVGVET